MNPWDTGDDRSLRIPEAALRATSVGQACRQHLGNISIVVSFNIMIII